MEFVPGGDLRSMLENIGSMNEVTVEGRAWGSRALVCRAWGAGVLSGCTIMYMRVFRVRARVRGQG